MAPLIMTIMHAYCPNSWVTITNRDRSSLYPGQVVYRVLLGRDIHSSSHTRLVLHGCTILKMIDNETAIIQFLHAARIENNRLNKIII